MTHFFKQNVSIRKRVIAHINQRIQKAEQEAEQEIRELQAVCKEEKEKLDEKLQDDSENVIDRHVKDILNLCPKE